MRKPKGDIGIIGLGVMGRNLILNMNDHGHRVVAYNRTLSRVDEFLEGPAGGTRVVGAPSLEGMASLLRKPRRVMLMVKAGKAVDETIDALLPVLERGDVIIDGGNSHFQDTIRRTKDLGKRGFLYLGVGISGGEEGARRGPSIMPGGSPRAWSLVKEIFRSIAARAPDGSPCCDWVGEDGAGHYVKMVHNGIEYSEMQLIGEAYHLMKEGLGLPHDAMRGIFAGWNRKELEGYLMEITRDILGVLDGDGRPMVEKVLDVTGQKGTGRLTCVNSLDLGVPVTMITEAVFARSLSALKEERVRASRVLKGPGPRRGGDSKGFVDDLRKALLASRVVSYAQGFMLMKEAAAAYGWNVDFGRTAHLWRAGCIIRSRMLGRMKEAFDRNPGLSNLMMDPYFEGLLKRCGASWRKVVTGAVEWGIPVPALSSGIAFYDGYRSARLPANLLQAQRDYFGAHTYERVDRPRGESFHTKWKGR